MSFHVGDEITLELPMPTMYFPSNPMEKTTIVPPRDPNRANPSSLGVRVRVPRSAYNQTYYMNLVLHTAIHITELHLSLFPVVGDQLMLAHHLRSKLSTNHADGNSDNTREAIGFVKTVDQRRKHLEAIVMPFLEIPAYLAQMVTRGVNHEEILRSAVETEKEQGIEFSRLLKDLVEWASTSTGGEPHYAMRCIIGAILLGLLPNIAASDLLRPESRKACSELVKNAHEMTKAVIIRAVRDADTDPNADIPPIAYSFFREEFDRGEVNWYGEWYKADTLEDFVGMIMSRTESETTAWAKRVHVLASYVGKQISLPLEAFGMFPHIAKRETELGDQIETYRTGNGDIEDPQANEMVQDLLAYQKVRAWALGDGLENLN